MLQELFNSINESLSSVINFGGWVIVVVVALILLTFTTLNFRKSLKLKGKTAKSRFKRNVCRIKAFAWLCLFIFVSIFGLYTYTQATNSLEQTKIYSSSEVEELYRTGEISASEYHDFKHGRTEIALYESSNTYSWFISLSQNVSKRIK